MVALGLKLVLQGVTTMNWETPVAIDLRLGMEITMYAEHR